MVLFPPGEKNNLSLSISLPKAASASDRELLLFSVLQLRPLLCNQTWNLNNVLSCYIHIFIYKAL